MMLLSILLITFLALSLGGLAASPLWTKRADEEGSQMNSNLKPQSVVRLSPATGAGRAPRLPVHHRGCDDRTQDSPGSCRSVTSKLKRDPKKEDSSWKSSSVLTRKAELPKSKLKRLRADTEFIEELNRVKRRQQALLLQYDGEKIRTKADLYARRKEKHRQQRKSAAKEARSTPKDVDAPAAATKDEVKVTTPPDDSTAPEQ